MTLFDRVKFVRVEYSPSAGYLIRFQHHRYPYYAHDEDGHGEWVQDAVDELDAVARWLRREVYYAYIENLDRQYRTVEILDNRKEVIYK